MSEGKSSAHIKAAYIGGVFAVIAACVGGMFLLANTLVEQGFVVIGPGVQVGNPAGETPSSAVNMSDTSSPTPYCIHPETLAQQQGWIGMELVDEYGGYRVQLSQPDQLPDLWEANGERPIRQFDPDRQMSAGIWIIYTPYDCREQFDFAPATQPTECTHPETLAQQRGWVGLGLVDKYGGYQVQLSQPDQLPPLWEANGARQIRQLDSNRELTPGVWTIYTPYSCRDKFGFEK